MGDILEIIETWRQKLLDLSKRNRLINCRLGRNGAIVLDHPQFESLWRLLVSHNQTLIFAWRRDLVPSPLKDNESDEDGSSENPSASDTNSDGDDVVQAPETITLEQCLASECLEEKHVLTSLPDKALARRLQRLALYDQTSQSEQGVNTLYVAFGLLRWYESQDSNEPIQSPIVLVPVTLTRPSLDSNWELQLADEEAVSNYCLSQLLEENFGLKIPEMPSDLFDDDRRLQAHLESIRNAIKSHPRWEVREDVILGTFTFQKIAMWTDLGMNGKRIGDHPICRALAERRLYQPKSIPSVPTARELDDKVWPENCFHILDADSSQHEAIEAVKHGLSLVLDGPPGTGKSQTISNLIAEFIAQGKTVLFVSEKAAALEVVKQRLDDAELGDFCLECHSHKANKRQVIEELGRCLTLHPERYESEQRQLDELKRIREQLNAYVRSLHAPVGALGLTPFQVHGRLAALKPDAVTRCPVSAPLDMTAAALDQRLECIRSLTQAKPVIDAEGRHPWRGCTAKAYSLVLDDDIRHHFAHLARLLPDYLYAFGGLRKLGLVTDSPSLPDLEKAYQLAREASTYPLVPKTWFSGDAVQTASQYIELYRLSQQYAEIQAELTAFKDGAIEENWCDPALRLTLTKRPLSELPRQPATTVRRELTRLQAMRPLLEELLSRITELSRVLDRAAEALKSPKMLALSVGQLPKIVRCLRLIGDLGRAAESWFEPLRRQELLEIVERGGQEASTLANERQDLAARFTTSALDDEVLTLLRESTRYRQFLKRMLPGWRRHRRAIQSLYLADPPRSARELLQDAARLLAYHERKQRLQQLGLANRNELQATSQGSVDWAGVRQSLEIVNQLQNTARLSAELIRELCEQGVDQEQIRDLATTLSRQLEEFVNHYMAFRACCDLREQPEIPENLGRLQEWLQELHSDVSQQLQDLAIVAELLEPNADIRLADCVQYAEKCEALADLRQRIRDIYNGLDDGLFDEARPELTDWTSVLKPAEWVLRFMKQYDSNPPKPLIAAATDEKVRGEICEILEKIDNFDRGTLRRHWEFIQELFPMDRSVSTGIVLETCDVNSLVKWLQERTSDVASLNDWITYQRIRSEIENLDLMPLLEEIERGAVPIEKAADAFLARFYRMWLDEVYKRDAVLAGFRVQEHERLIARFQELDEAHIHNGYRRIRARQLRSGYGFNEVSLTAPASSELGVLQREVNKRRRHLPLRQLFQRIPSLLLKLKPCIMMSPLAVSTYLDSPDIHFDLVIFDEASQVRPHDAICAIYRGDQLVVAGDQKQLPPTNFFELQDDTFSDDDDEEPTDGMTDFESILDVCATIGLPRKRLRWHYRSRRESLIAFSNEHFYGRELITFPSILDVAGQSAVSLEYVPNGRWRSGTSGGYNTQEALRTADLVMMHARNDPQRSLGVITMNQRQQVLVLEEIEKRRRAHPELEEFFDPDRKEPFFVKNLENVQGDERDVIFLSVGYAPDQNGSFAMRFGPLNTEGGERRLNVAVSRAKYAIRLISSIRSHDIDVGRTKGNGPRLLKAYLDFAERGIEALATVTTEDGREADSPFEIEVARALREAGLDVRTQIGCGGFRIDLAIVDPQRPGRYVLGVECDGATYHSSVTARDRDRLRQEVLEGLGWRICRIWSTDWIRDPRRQVERVLQEYEKALKQPIEVLPRIQKQPRRQRDRSAQTIAPNGVPQYSYNNIHDVSAELILQLVSCILEVHGATSEDDLIVTVARHLGFARTGARIKERLARTIREMEEVGMIQRGDAARLRLVQRF